VIGWCAQWRSSTAASSSWRKVLIAVILDLPARYSARGLSAGGGPAATGLGLPWCPVSRYYRGASDGAAVGSRGLAPTQPCSPTSTHTPSGPSYFTSKY